jgi:hypothetical protein
MVGIYVDNTIITGLLDAVAKFRELLAKQYTMNEQSSLADSILVLKSPGPMKESTSPNNSISNRNWMNSLPILVNRNAYQTP